MTGNLNTASQTEDNAVNNGLHKRKKKRKSNLSNSLEDRHIEQNMMEENWNISKGKFSDASVQSAKTVEEAKNDVQEVPLPDLPVSGSLGTSLQTADTHTEICIVLGKKKNKKKKNRKFELSNSAKNNHIGQNLVAENWDISEGKFSDVSIQTTKTVVEAKNDVCEVPLTDLQVHGSIGTSLQTANSHTVACLVMKKRSRKKKRCRNDLNKLLLETGGQRDSDVASIDKLRKEDLSLEFFENDRITNKKSQEVPMDNNLNAAEPSNASGCSYYMDSVKKRNRKRKRCRSDLNKLQLETGGERDSDVASIDKLRKEDLSLEFFENDRITNKKNQEVLTDNNLNAAEPSNASGCSYYMDSVKKNGILPEIDMASGKGQYLYTYHRRKKLFSGTLANSVNGAVPMAESNERLHLMNMKDGDELQVVQNVVSEMRVLEEENFEPPKVSSENKLERIVEEGPVPLMVAQNSSNGANANRRKKRKAKMKMVHNQENKDENTIEGLEISAEQNVEEFPTHCKKTSASSSLEIRDVEQNVVEFPTHCKKTNATSLLEIRDVAECSHSHSLETINRQGGPFDLCASPGRVSLSDIGRKLLVLDLNGLLVDIVSCPPMRYRADARISNKALFKRPFCDDFLKFCFEKFNIGVWSSRYKRNVDKVVDFLMGDMKRKLLFCWDQSHCTCTGFKTIDDINKPLVLKELKKLWDKHDPNLPWEIGEYNQSNTLLLDDSPYKALRNPPSTAIFPSPYSFLDANDNALGPGGNIRVYLEGLAMAGDVQKYVEQHPFGQHAISSRNPSWSFYLKIITGNQSSEREEGCQVKKI